MTEPRDDTHRDPARGRADAQRGDAPGGGVEPSDGSGVRGDEEAPLRALEPAEIRARRRPRVVAYAWLWQLACGALLAIPVHAWARRAWGAHPDGDAVLFRPGGGELLTWLGSDDPSLAIVVRTTFLMLLAFVAAGHVVTGALVAALATGAGPSGRPPPGWALLRAGVASFGPLLGLGALAVAIQAVVLGAGVLASSAVERALRASLGDARSFTASVVVLALFGAATLLVGVVADLGRVAVARRVALSSGPVAMGAAVRDGALAATRTARRAGGRAQIAWGWRALLAIGLVYVGAALGDAVSSRGGGALIALFVAHQLIALGRASLRASWLANALRLVVSSEGSAPER